VNGKSYRLWWAAVLLAPLLLPAARPAPAPAAGPTRHIVLPVVLATPGVAFVSDEADLRRAIAQANVDDPALNIEFLADIVLTAALPPLDNPETTIIELRGNGHTLDGHGYGPILSIGPGTWVTVERLTLTGGAAPGADGCGGAIFVAGLLSLRDSVVSGNSAARGGGLCVIGANLEDTAQLTVYDSVVSGNTAQLGGGGIFARAEGGAAFNVSVYGSTLARNRTTDGDGGAIHATAVNGTLRTAIWMSAVTGNFAVNGGGLYHVADAAGGGIAEANVYNTTFSGNVALGNGGAIANYVTSPIDEERAAAGTQQRELFEASVEATFTTITANTAYHGSGVFSPGGAFFWAFATIIAGNAPGGGDCGQRIGSNGYTMDGDGSCQLFADNDDLPRGRADLLPLAANPPGATATHALGPSSQARDVVEPLFCEETLTDQRGVARPQPAGGWCDIGAYEEEGE
jgi:predicted outer membrane repeat protein